MGKGGCALENIIQKLRTPQRAPSVAAGFDGYVDSILRVCRTASTAGPEYFKTMEDFGEYIRAKSRKSCSLELKLQTEKLGGNTPIFSQAIAKLGARVTSVGAFGLPQVHPVFEELQKSCQLWSIGQPGRCQALEFEDGKVMLANNSAMQVDYPGLIQVLPPPKLIELAGQADMLGFFNWSEVRGSTSIWQGFLRDVLPALSERKLLFLDLSDCSQRPAEELQEAAKLMRNFSEYTETILSLNLNEAEALCRALGLHSQGPESMAAELQGRLGGGTVVIHLMDGACCAGGGHMAFRANRQIKRPKLSTGGGDNFNAGYAYGILQGMTPPEALTVANEVSGFYVSHGHSPNRDELIRWIENGPADCRETN